jgi:hypothetical protein
MRLVGRAALALLVALVLAACGSSSVAAPGAASPTPSRAPAKPGCDLAPASTVKAHLGVQAAEPRATTNGPVTVCAYAVGGNENGVIVRFQTGFSHSAFLTGRDGFTQSGQPTADVAGVGDEAYSSALADFNTLVARKGTVEILITAEASVDAERGLMLELLAKV